MKKGIDYVAVGVGALIFNKEGKIFLSLRGREARNESGKWEFPGGGVEFGDTLKDTIKREIKEEFGFEIKVIELLDVCDHIIPEEKQHWVSPSFICAIKSGAPKILEPKKCDDIGWFTIDEILKLPLTIITRYNLESLRKKYPKGNPNYI